MLIQVVAMLLAMFYFENDSEVPLQDTTSGDAQLRVEGSNKVIPGQVLKLVKNCKLFSSFFVSYMNRLNTCRKPVPSTQMK